jgi:hypothetical protein
LISTERLFETIPLPIVCGTLDVEGNWLRSGICSKETTRALNEFIYHFHFFPPIETLFYHESKVFEFTGRGKRREKKRESRKEREKGEGTKEGPTKGHKGAKVSSNHR